MDYLIKGISETRPVHYIRYLCFIVSLCHYVIWSVLFTFILFILNAFPCFFQNMIYCVYIKSVICPLSGNIYSKVIICLNSYNYCIFQGNCQKVYVLHPDFRWFIRNLLRKKRTFHNRSATSGVGLIYLLFITCQLCDFECNLICNLWFLFLYETQTPYSTITKLL